MCYLKHVLFILVFVFIAAFVGTAGIGGNVVPAPENHKSQITPSTQRLSKKVFIDARKIYWGNIGDLTKPDAFVRILSSKEEIATNSYQPRNAAHQMMVELRAALKAFKKYYGVEIVWYKNTASLPDTTDQFIEFWSSKFKTQVDVKDVVNTTNTINQGETR